MRKWLQLIFGKQNETTNRLGVPPVRRLKTHTAASGYVYQYYFEGYVESEAEAASSTERKYEFLLHPERPDPKTVTIVFPATVRGELEKAYGRELSNSECYAVAKLSLFTLLDETESPSHVPDRHEISSYSAHEIWELLDL